VCRKAVFLAAMLVMAPLGARGADLIVWWDEGYYPEEDAALREIIAAFEQETGKQVALVQFQQNELPHDIGAALEVGQPPDFAFGANCATTSDNGSPTIGS
jgi:ABC-type glycerol-3-phosphate transport system substrate-binding protein